MSKLPILLLAGLAFSCLPPCACAQDEPLETQAAETSQQIQARTWHIDRKTFCKMCSGGRPSMPEAMDYLKARGVTFPKGSAASYNATHGNFIIRNTYDNLVAVEKIIQNELLGKADNANKEDKAKGKKKHKKRQKKSRR